MNKSKTTIRIAHRGYSGVFPENTLLAFQKAIESQADMLELDIQMLQDGEIIIFHDDNLKRLCNVDLEIGSLDLEKLSKYFVGEQLIPTLEKFFIAFDKNFIPVNIEIKEQSYLSTEQKNNLVDKVLKLIDKYQRKDQMIVSSFNWNYLKQIQTIDSTIKLGVLDHTFQYEKALAFRKNYSAYSYHLFWKHVNKELIERVHGDGWKIYAYTIDDIITQKELTDYGIDGIFTNYFNKT